jgi:hypothetical protein
MMASAMMPPRRPSEKSEPSESRPDDAGVAFLKTTLKATALTGVPPGDYCLKWVGGGKMKKSSTCSIAQSGGGPFKASIPLYTKARRYSPTSAIVAASSDPADSLDTTLMLCRAHDESVVAQTTINIGDFLSAGHQSTSVSMPGGIAVELSIAAKAIGDTKLVGLSVSRGPSEDVPVNASAGASGVPSTVAVDTAAKLERLRSDVVERSNQIDALKAQTAAIDQALRAKASEPAQQVSDVSEVSSLRVRVRALEEERAVLEREKVEAENRIGAHVQHAAKIKTTYNQLAAWYNNLRNEHAELQRRHPESTLDTARDLGAGSVATTHEEDLVALEKERERLQDLLQKERDEKLEIHSRNASVLEEKSAALAQLQEQLNSSMTELDAAKVESEKAKAELEESRSLSVDPNVLAKAHVEIEDLKQSHEAELTTLRRQLMAEQAKVEEEKRAKTTAHDNIQTERAALQRAVDAAAMREAADDRKLQEALAELATLKVELEAVRSDHQAAALARDGVEVVDKSAVSELKAALEVAQQETKSAQESAEKRDAQAHHLQQVAEELRVELDATSAQLERERRDMRRTAVAPSNDGAEIESLKSERDHAIRELFRVRKALNAELKAVKKERDALAETGAPVSAEPEAVVLSKQLRELETEVDRLESVIAEQAKEMATEKERHEHDLHAAKGEVEAAQAKLSARVAEHKASLQLNSSKLLESATVELKTKSAKLAEVESEAANHSKKIQELQNELQAKNSTQDGTARELAFLKSSKEIEAKRAADELDNLRKSLEDATRIQTEQETDMANSRRLIETLRADLALAEAARDDTMVQLSAINGELASLKESMDTASKSTSSAEQQRNDAQKLIAETRAEREALASELKHTKASLAAESRVRSERDGETDLLRSRISQLTASMKLLDDKIAVANRSLNEESIAKEEAINETARVLATLQDTERDHEARKEECNALQIKLDHAVQELAIAKREAAEKALDAENVEQGVKDVASRDRELETLAAELAEYRTAAASAGSQVAEASKEKKFMQAEIDELQSKLATARAASSKDTVHALKAELATMQRAVAEKNREFENLTNLLKQMTVAHEQSSADYDALFEQHNQLKHDIQSSKTAEVRLNALEESAAKERQNLEGELKSARSSIRKLTEENQDLAVAVEQLRELLKTETDEKKKSGDVRRELRATRTRLENLESELARAKSENQELLTRMDALNRLQQGSADALVDDLIRCKLDLANAWEQIDHYKQRVKQLSPEHHISPNSSGNQPSSSSFERRGTKK